MENTFIFPPGYNAAFQSFLWTSYMLRNARSDQNDMDYSYLLGKKKIECLCNCVRKQNKQKHSSK